MQVVDVASVEVADDGSLFGGKDYLAHFCIGQRDFYLCGAAFASGKGVAQLADVLFEVFRQAETFGVSLYLLRNDRQAACDSERLCQCLRRLIARAFVLLAIHHHRCRNAA